MRNIASAEGLFKGVDEFQTVDVPSCDVVRCHLLLTRLSFGLSIAPKVMTAIIKVTKVLQENEQLTRGTSAYIDDIFVDADVVSAQEIMAHLKPHGLEAKAPEHLGAASGTPSIHSVEDRMPSTEKENRHLKLELFAQCKDQEIH